MREESEMKKKNFVARFFVDLAWYSLYVDFRNAVSAVHSTVVFPRFSTARHTKWKYCKSIYIKYLILTDFKTINPSIYAKSLVIVLSQD